MHDARDVVRRRLVAIGIEADAVPELIDELVQHLEDRYRASLAAGMDEAAARAAACRELDGCERFAAEYRAYRMPPPSPIAGAAPTDGWWAGFCQDARHAMRTLRRSPGFTITALGTVALTTGPTMIALGVANWLFFRPPAGVAEPSRLGVVWFGRWVEGGFAPSRISNTHVADIRTGLTAIAGIAGAHSTSVNLSLESPDVAPRIVTAQFISANYFDVLGTPMVEGRGFLEEEDRDAGGAPVAVLGYALARALFPDQSAVGRIVRVNNHRLTVVGIARRGFEGIETGESVSVWLPGLSLPRVTHLAQSDWTYGTDRGPFSNFVIRLRPGASFARADAELRGAARSLGDRAAPEARRFQSIAPQLFPGLGIDPLARASMAHFSRLLVGAGLVLVLVGMANLANLLLFRATRRTHEAAVRRALGASVGRLVQLHVLEGLIVAGAGAAGGVLLAVAAQSFVEGAIVPAAGRLGMAIDWRLLVAAAVLAVLIGAGLAIAPARLAARVVLTGVLASGARLGTRPGTKLRTTLAIVQCALSLTLLIGGLLFLETLRQIRNVDLGFDIRRVSTFSFAMRGQAYTADRTRDFYRILIDTLSRTRGIDAASAATVPPLTITLGRRVLPPDVAARTDLSSTQQSEAALRVLSNDVTPEYFSTLGMRFLDGRSFTPDETIDPAATAIVSESLALRLYGTRNASGRILTMPAAAGSHRRDARVVGVVNDVRWRDAREPIQHIVYLPFSAEMPSTFLMVQSSRSFEETRAIVQSAAARIDPALPVASDLTMTAVANRRIVQQRIFAWLLGVLAVLGFLVAGIGTYGLVSQAVIERLREFGIRLAIGAQPVQIVALVVRQAAYIVLVGVPAGLLLAALLSQAFRAQLFGVGPLAPRVYLSAVVGVVVAVSLALIGPARRALGINPSEVIRAE